MIFKIIFQLLIRDWCSGKLLNEPGKLLFRKCTGYLVHKFSVLKKE